MASNQAQVSKEPIVKEKITMKSTRWKGKTENYVISQIKANKKSDDIINELSKSLELADDVVQFIKDNAGTAE